MTSLNTDNSNNNNAGDSKMIDKALIDSVSKWTKPGEMKDFYLEKVLGLAGQKHLVVEASRRAHKTWNLQNLANNLARNRNKRVALCVMNGRQAEDLARHTDGYCTVFTARKANKVMADIGQAFDVLLVDETYNLTSLLLETFRAVPIVCIVHTPLHHVELDYTGFTKISVCALNPALWDRCICDKCIELRLPAANETEAEASTAVPMETEKIEQSK